MKSVNSPPACKQSDPSITETKGKQEKYPHTDNLFEVAIKD
jgi:hypothetical protein